ncbi:MAG: hypothetical protein M5U26_16875 [Planctomycetota bacterium]|nr:hypothetical protein [Planctomycetota bacterium]
MRAAPMLLAALLLAGCGGGKRMQVKQSVTSFPLLEEHSVPFKAKLLNIEPIGRGDYVVTAVTPDPHYVVSVNIVELEDEKAPFKPGDTKHFAVNEVDSLFGGADRYVIGKVYSGSVQYQTAKNGRWRLRDLKLDR